MATEPHTLYGIPGSHPTYAAALMLDAKGVGYRRIDLPQWFHRPILRLLRFPGATVPALVLDGRRVQTTRAIARELERLRPEPPLLPADPEARARDEAVRQDLAALPGHLDRIDGWIADGLLGGSPPNVADYQVATSLALLMSHDDLRPIIAARPAGELAQRLAGGYPGRTPATFPREWLPAA